MRTALKRKDVSYIRYLCILMAVALITTTTVTTAFAAEGNSVVPKMAFAVNSSEVLLFNGTDGVEPQVAKTPIPVISVDGTTYVPIRAFSNILGYSVDYIAENKTITIGYMGKSWNFSPIAVLKELSNENVYFSLHGNAYTKVQNFGLPENLKTVKKDNVLMLYSNDPNSNMTSGNNGTNTNYVTPVGVVKDKVSESALTEEASEGALKNPAKVNEEIDTLSFKDWTNVFSVQENQPLLTPEFIKAMNKRAIEPTEKYMTTLINDYDGKYYRPFVNPYVPYSYPQMIADIAKLKAQYPEYIRTASAGKSVEGRDLTTIEFGNGSKHIYLLGSHHAREYISTSYIMKFVNEAAYFAKTGINPTKYDIRNMLRKVTFHIIPMVNPDGVNLVQNGIESVSPAFREKVRAMPIRDSKYGYRSWKSNINGVDLNRNYPSNWTPMAGKNASSMYPGVAPASEPEVQAVMNYMKMYPPEAIVATHSQGQLIYWSNPENNLGEMGRKIIKSSGFHPIMNRSQDAKAGYLSNYARDTYHKYEITIELCRYIGPYPYPDNQFDQVWAPAKDILYIVGDEIAKK